MKRIFSTLAFFSVAVLCALAKSYSVTSPDGKLVATIDDSNGLTYSVAYAGQTLIAPSAISMTIDNGKTITIGTKVKAGKVQKHEGTIKAVVYKKSEVQDNYNSLTFQLNDRFSLVFRAYDEGVAYRFVAAQKADFIVNAEQVNFNFAKDWNVYIPYVNAKGTIEQQFANSSENTYAHIPVSQTDPKHLSFMPFIVEADNGVKMVITESALENYPGMYVLNNGGHSLKGIMPNYPKEIKQGGHNNLQLKVLSRENYIAKAKAAQEFPWRIIAVAAHEKDILTNDMVYRLGSPSRVADTHWIKPGKVAWDWWNNWGLYNVPFKAGIDNRTYKYYIDFASKQGIEYVILDEGWAVNLKADLFQVIPEINIKELVDYGRERNVGIILWAGYYAFDREMERVCKTYSEMGVKGFKVDFIDRDDQLALDFMYRTAEMAAKYKLMIDFHGVCKPAGLNRTYPNVINFEGVAGLEQNKWSTMEQYDQVPTDVLLPFTRMFAGQMDYTQGAMLNGTRSTYRPNNSEPMSQGTRTRQLAQYAIFFSPLNMLCDSPTHYEENPDCTEFIAKFPVVWDETVPLNCELGKYVSVARRSGNQWYIGAINDWTAIDLTLDLSPLKIAGRAAKVVKDGPSAAKIAADHLHERIVIPSDGKIKVHLAPGGGFVLQTL